MRWVPLKTRQMRAAAYDAERQRLFIKTSRGSTRIHNGILPHMFDNLVASEEKQFYYRNYIEPALVSDRRSAASIAGQLLKIGAIGAGALLLSAPGLVI